MRYISIFFVFLMSSCASQAPAEKSPDYASQLARAKQAARSSSLSQHLDFASLSDLHYAAGWASVSLAQYLLEQGEQINGRDNQGRTPLFLAAGFNNVEMLGFLIDNGANPSLANSTGSLPIHMAAGFNTSAGVLKRLLEDKRAAAGVNAQNKLGSSPLHWAAGSAAIEQTKLLLQYGAQLNLRDNLGRIPLDIAQNPPNAPSPEAARQEVLLLSQAQSN